MDVTDRASDVEEATREAAIAAQLALARQPVRASATNCEDCGTEIPEGRRTAQPGVLLCVDCKCIQERMNRR